MLCFLMARVVVMVTAVLHLVHPLVHGTPLDSGTLDSCMAQLDMLALHYGATR